MTAIQHTVEIGADRRSLRLLQPLPESIPCGTARVILQFVPSSEPESPAPAKWVNPLLGRAKGSRLTVERFLAMKNEERALEAAIDARLRQGCGPFRAGEV
jgi:hypothetical protein